MKRLTGTIIAQSGLHTIKVDTKRTVRHPLYQKSMTVSKRFLVHTESDDYSVGETVVIEPCRALSKNKHYRIYKQTSLKGTKA